MSNDLVKRIEELEAKLKKAVAALDEAMYFLDIDEDDILNGGGLYEVIKTYAELGGSMSSEFSDALKKMNRPVEG